MKKCLFHVDASDPCLYAGCTANNTSYVIDCSYVLAKYPDLRLFSGTLYVALVYSKLGCKGEIHYNSSSYESEMHDLETYPRSIQSIFYALHNWNRTCRLIKH